MSLLFAREFGLALLTLAAGLFVAWARVYLGVHFPADMLGAMGVAVLAYAGLTPVWRMTGDTVTQFAERLYRSVMAQPISRGWVRR